MVALGGALGASFRYGCQLLIIQWSASSFPIGTLTVNALGSFLIGFGWLLLGNDQTRLLFLVGLLGGFTTFSSFSMETIKLWENGMSTMAAMNILLNNVVAIGLCWLGYQAGKLII